MGVEQSLTGVPQFDNIEVVSSGTASIDTTAGTDNAAATIPHGFTGFVPIPMVAIFQNGIYQPLPAVTAFNSGANNTVGMQTYFYAATDSTNLYINFLAGFSANWGVFTFKWYLLRIRS